MGCFDPRVSLTHIHEQITVWVHPESKLVCQPHYKKTMNTELFRHLSDAFLVFVLRVAWGGDKGDKNTFNEKSKLAYWNTVSFLCSLDFGIQRCCSGWEVVNLLWNQTDPNSEAGKSGTLTRCYRLLWIWITDITHTGGFIVHPYGRQPIKTYKLRPLRRMHVWVQSGALCCLHNWILFTDAAIVL